ncbi:MAG: AMP-binding protein [Spirochaetaceae bacterium]|nr:AMP-binding protein [Spirochaetaceae bacterium]
MMFQKYVKGNSDYNNYQELKDNFSIAIPENFNFAYDVVDEYARTEPDRTALVWCDDKGQERTFSFQDLKVASDKTANFLLDQGIRKGDAVMLILRRRYEFWYFMLALHKIGAIAVPATNLLLKSDIEYRTNAAAIKMIVSFDDRELQNQIDLARDGSPTVERLVTVEGAREGWLSFEEIYPTLSPDFSRPQGEGATANNDIMLLYFTSGTSGYPKMVQHNFTYPLGHIVTARYWQKVVDGGLHLTLAETGWAKAVWGKIYGQWLAGSAVFAYDMVTFVPARLLEKMAKYKVTTFCAPPTVYRYLVRQDFTKHDLSSLVHCTTAGEALNGEIYNRFLEKTGIKMKEGYGQTELTLTIGNFDGMEPKPGSMGKPAPGYTIDIVDSEGASCKAEEVGEIVIRLDKGRPFGMFAGYYKDEQRTQEAFMGGLYHTGDMAYRDEDGYFWFVGRIDDMIKSAGYRISPFEVESTLMQHPAVLECAVTGVADDARNQVVKATIVVAPGYEESHQLSQELQEFAKKETAAYKAPRLIEFVKELPKTISGKIRHVAIRNQDKRK